MTNKININLVIITLALFLVPAISFGQADAGVDAGVDVDAGMDATTTDIDSETGVDVEVDSNSDNAEANEESEMEANSNNEGALSVNSLGVTVISSSQVDSEEDLQVFSANASKRNNSVANIAISSDGDTNSRVSVTYNHRVRFLGFIPVNLKSTTEVEAREDGEVEVNSKLPWWRFMASGVGDIESSIESRVSNNNEVMANASVDASASAKARVAEAIIAELDARAAAESNASMNN